MSTVLKDLHKKKGIDATLDRIETAFYHMADEVAKLDARIGHPTQKNPVRLKINDSVDRLQLIRILTNAGYGVFLDEQESEFKGRPNYFVGVYEKES